MQKLGLSQSLQQKLSPQQIQFIKLLQVPTVEFEQRIESELEENPALEEGNEQLDDDYAADESREEFDEQVPEGEDINLDDYLKHDDFSGYKMYGDGGGNDEDKDLPIASASTMSDMLNSQLGYLRLDERQEIIAGQLVGSIEEDGYIRRELEAIVNDLAFSQGINTDMDELEEILQRIQSFEPAGIGARNLQECLLLQLERKADIDPEINLAINILEHYFDEFTRKHYSKIIKRLEIEEDELKIAVDIITKLNPKPGASVGGSNKIQYVIPDFILTVDEGKVHVALNARNAPELRVNRSYSEMIDTYEKSSKKDKKLKETVSFVKQKLDSARWFIDAIKQRQHTLLQTMNCIVQLQYDFFLEGDESKLKPMILKDIAEAIDMDISTVSRVVNSKTAQTEYGNFPLKFFFSESVQTQTGEDVSNKEVKHHLKEIVDGEDKRKPLSDDKIEKLLKDKGYSIARRTVAKYREQLGIPVARLRKEL